MTDTEVFIGRVLGGCTVVGDESGGWSKKAYGPLSMSIAVSETSRAYEFGRISEHYPKNTRGAHGNKELKWESSSDRIRKKVLRDIAELRPDIYIVTDERKGIALKNVERFQCLFRRIAKELIDSSNADHIDFLMDETPLMKEGRGKMIVKEMIGDKTFGYKHVRSEESPLVQTQDFVAGAANRAREAEDGRFIDILKRNIVSWIIEK